eukprot:TRINITY_DN97455_c0_g1_i1.p2 TRINITY_DN97455_c0_g1~~TRINITY_DN97455_c0_g1_i1.p2  ORF type:complete len:140 (-),score=13.79 TRINITY_DN97455_c0_g1_i1:44-463(-)
MMVYGSTPSAGRAEKVPAFSQASQCRASTAAGSKVLSRVIQSLRNVRPSDTWRHVMSWPVYYRRGGKRASLQPKSALTDRVVTAVLIVGQAETSLAVTAAGPATAGAAPGSTSVLSLPEPAVRRYPADVHRARPGAWAS